MEALTISLSGNALLVVELRDVYTSAAPRDPRISVLVPGVLRAPIRKSGGLFVFQGVADGTYQSAGHVRLLFAGDGAGGHVKADPLNPVVTVPLTPSPAYPFGQGIRWWGGVT